jgi:hypothetical protein
MRKTTAGWRWFLAFGSAEDSFDYSASGNVTG